MTYTPKECPTCEGVLGKVFFMPNGEPEKCGRCYGLGWIPKPGDELTAVEAETLSGYQKIDYFDGHWKRVRICFMPAKVLLCMGSKFRVAPAPQEQPAKVERISVAYIAQIEAHVKKVVHEREVLMQQLRRLVDDCDSENGTPVAPRLHVWENACEALEQIEDSK